ncbi:MAG: glycosyltransferase family 2 protein, partial [Chthoniobacterales bacterium]
MSKISIIIPAYNASEYLDASIRSCLEQNLKPLEVIVIDDGSQDDTPLVVEKFTKKITYRRTSNQGVAAARDFGASLASGHWLLFLDADDILRKNALEDLITISNKNAKADVIYGKVWEERPPPLSNRENGFDFCAGKPPLPTQRNIHRCAIITPGSAIIKKTLFQQVGGFTSGTEPLEDRELWLRCGLISEIAYCSSVLLEKRWVANSHGTQHA